MDWLKALEAAKKPRNPTEDLGSQNEADLIENALESTANAAFNIPVQAETKNEAVRRASREIADQGAQQMKFAAANEIKTKIERHGIDPVALGITVREANGIERPITKEEWEGASDARWVEKIATAAALENEKRLREGWQTEAMKPRNHSNKYDPETMRDGRIMSSAGANEDVADRPHQMPANCASIFDPFKLDRYAMTENAHDKAILEKRAKEAKRKEELKLQYKFVDPGVEPMNGAQVVKAGGEDRDIFNQRVPRNQVSMLDLQGTEKLSPEEIKTHLEQLFLAKIEDNGQTIKEANQKHKESIQRKPDEDSRSWEKLAKPLSTGELQKKLMDAFTCPPKPDGQ